MKCEHTETRLRWVEFRDKTEHIEELCTKCNAHQKYYPRKMASLLDIPLKSEKPKKYYKNRSSKIASNLHQC